MLAPANTGEKTQAAGRNQHYDSLSIFVISWDLLYFLLSTAGFNRFTPAAVLCVCFLHSEVVCDIYTCMLEVPVTHLVIQSTHLNFAITFFVLALRQTVFVHLFLSGQTPRHPDPLTSSPAPLSFQWLWGPAEASSLWAPGGKEEDALHCLTSFNKGSCGSQHHLIFLSFFFYLEDIIQPRFPQKVKTACLFSCHNERIFTKNM